MESFYQRIVSDPRVKQFGVPVIAAIVGIQTLRYLNQWYSQKALNHYVSNSKWDWKKEIVVVTGGGGSGIGAKIVDLLASKNVRVIVLDISPLKNPLRKFRQADPVFQR